MNGIYWQKYLHHNKRVFDDLKLGDRIQIKKAFYSHWGVYVGDGKIVHLVGVDDDDEIDRNVHLKHKFTISGKTFNKAKVCLDEFWKVVGDHKAFINNCDDKLSPMDACKIVERANTNIGNVGYNIIYSNCEHFATWCRYDVRESRQVNRFAPVAVCVVCMGASIGIIYDISSKKENLKQLISLICECSDLFGGLLLLIIYSILVYLIFISEIIVQPRRPEEMQNESCPPVMEVKDVTEETDDEERKHDIDMSHNIKLNEQNTGTDLTYGRLLLSGGSKLHKYHIGCKKNPVHTEFIPVDTFTINHLPEGHHDNDLYEFVKVTADLTVRVNVKMTSPHRPEFWPNTHVSYPFYNMRDKTKWRTGSGMVGSVKKFMDGFSDDGRKHWENYTTCWCKQCQHSDTASRTWWEFVVYTAAHVVFDGIEASHTSLRLFFDSEESPVVSVDQVSVVDANIERDMCLLRCVTCDKNLGDKMDMLQRHYDDVWIKVLYKYREIRDVDKFNFIVSHPHGCCKQVSIGHWVDKYRVKDDLYKFTYTTCTCPGSGGASVNCLGYGGFPGDYLIHSGSLNSKLNYSGAAHLW